jgi:hypothetical protein
LKGQLLGLGIKNNGLSSCGVGNKIIRGKVVLKR